MKKNKLKNRNSWTSVQKVSLLWNYLQCLGSEWQQFSKSEVEQWFKNHLRVFVHGRSTSAIWEECLTRYREGSLPTAVTASLRPRDFADVEVFSTKSDQHENAVESTACQDDIDALLSAAGTFVGDQKTFASSVIGPHSAISTGTQLMQKNVDIPSQSQESPVNVTGDVPASATSMTYGVHRHTAASNVKRIHNTDKISWITSAQEEIGTFFINKPFCGQDCSNSTPAILPASCTSVCSLSFEELVVNDGLLAAVLTPGCCLQTSVKDRFIEHFPQSVQLELLLKKNDAETVSTDYVMLCSECPQAVASAEESSVPQCPKCRLVRARCFDSNLLQAKFMLLRYVDKVKFIVLSSPLSLVHWQKAIQLGWFCYFPVVPDSEETCDVQKETAFQASLSAFLKSLGLNVETLLRGVDFSQLSPAVNLISTVPGTYTYMDGSQFGMLALHQPMRQMPLLLDSRIQSVYCTVRLGKKRTSHVLNKIFYPAAKRHSAELCRIAFPSGRRMSECLGNVSAADAQILSASFENNDRSDTLKRNCYNLCDYSTNLLHHFNLAFQYQMCRANDINESTKWYGWMLIGSQSIGVGSWGDVDDSSHLVHCYLYHLGIAFFPYVTSADETVRAVNLRSICPFSLGSLVAYGPREKPHFPAYAPPAKRAAEAKHTVMGRESSWQSCAATSSQAGNSDSSCDRVDVMPELALQQKLAGQQMETAVESVRHGSHLPDNWDEEDLLYNTFRGGVEKFAERFPVPSREELDAITMNPIRMTTDLKWLESHVRTICGGQLPPLVGPYAIPFLVSQLEGMQRHFTDGFTG